MRISTKAIAIAVLAVTLSSVGLSTSSAGTHHTSEHNHTGTAISQISAIDTEVLISTIEFSALACAVCIITFAAIRRLSNRLINEKLLRTRNVLLEHLDFSYNLKSTHQPARDLILRM